MGKLIELGAAGTQPDTVIEPQAAGAWGAMSDSLWPAWNGMIRAEARVLETFGDMLGEKLLVLWALSRFGDGAPGDSTLAALVDESGRPLFGDWLAEDMLFAAFALGVAWAGDAPAAAAEAPRDSAPPVRRADPRHRAI
jgi:hypothetical protein